MTALESNKEDTGEVIKELGRLQEELDRVKLQLKRSYWFSTIGISVASLIPVTIGAIEYSKGDIYGKDYMWAGLGFFVGAQIIYQGGHWIFKWF